MDYDLDEILNIEQSSYEKGYKEGEAHGAIHGSIEGAALGREKGFEIWEELGYYKGFAVLWRALAERDQRKERESKEGVSSRSLNHITHLLQLISHFPISNPSSSPSNGDGDGNGGEEDLPKLMAQIRSRYRALCASLGVKPRLQPAIEGFGEVDPNSSPELRENTGEKKKKKVWTLDSGQAPAPGSLSY